MNATVMDKCSSAIRGVFISSPGKKFVVADLAGIENRVLAWLAGEAWKLEAFLDFDLRDGHDMYKLAYAKAFGIDPATVDKHQRSIGKVLELMLGYAGGVGAYITGALTYRIDLEDMAEKAWDVIPTATRDDAASFLEWQLGQGKGQYGLSDRAFIVCDSFKRLWRETNPAIAAWWKELEDVVRRAINTPGQTLTCRMHKIRRDGAWLRIMLPSGRYLCYPNPRVEDDGGITFMGVNQFTRKWERLRTYGGRLVENCIAEGTEVLTENHGWLAVERVTPDSRVWDGDEWVSFSHCHYSGKQTTISTYGVRMTPDHLVLTEEGWKNASSCEGHNRAACRLPDGYSLPGIGRQEVDMGSGLRLRQSNSHGSLPAKEELAEGRQMLVRLHEESDHIFSPFSPRYERSSGFRRMAVNAGSVPTSYASGLQKLWRKGNSSLRAVAGKVRKLLGRHGSEVSPRVDIGALGQLARVFGGELRLANTQAPSEQHPSQPLDRHSSRPDDVHGSLGVLRSGVLDSSVPLGSRMAGGAGPDTRRVFDLVNCGPRSRFVVRGDDGLPLIVHNCCQAVARDVLAYSLPSIEKAGYEIVLTVHDEIISEAPDTDDYTHEHLAELMSAGCDWTEGLPLAAAGFEAYRYRKG